MPFVIRWKNQKLERRHFVWRIEEHDLLCAPQSKQKGEKKRRCFCLKGGLPVFLQFLKLVSLNVEDGHKRRYILCSLLTRRAGLLSLFIKRPCFLFCLFVLLFLLLLFVMLPRATNQGGAPTTHKINNTQPKTAVVLFFVFFFFCLRVCLFLCVCYFLSQRQLEGGALY